MLVRANCRKSVHERPELTTRHTSVLSQSHCASVSKEERLEPQHLLNALMQYSGSTQRYGR